MHMIVEENLAGKALNDMPNIIEQNIDDILTDILEDYRKNRAIDRTDIYNEPDKKEVIAILKNLLSIVYPGFFRDKIYKIYHVDHTVSMLIEDVIFHLNKQIMVVMRHSGNGVPDEDALARYAQETSVAFMKTIPRVREYLETDLAAAYDGDPAAKSTDEIILAYPGIYAITIFRLAHELFLLGVPLLPRMMTEYAHNKTGIDIHPGATIGKYFFIDHGTGIVIGETTEIGEHVKLYQGVTLGALSTRGGQDLRGKKRHPTIRDHVTIYSGASILGGNTVIEEGVVIGGNAFITSSIRKGTKVSVKSQDLVFYVEDEETAGECGIVAE